MKLAPKTRRESQNNSTMRRKKFSKNQFRFRQPLRRRRRHRCPLLRVEKLLNFFSHLENEKPFLNNVVVPRWRKRDLRMGPFAVVTCLEAPYRMTAVGNAFWRNPQAEQAKILVPWLSSLTHIFSASISLTFYRLSLSLSFSSSARCNAFGTQPGSARNELGNKVGTKYKSFSATCNLHFGTICENNSFVFAKQIYRL